MATTTVETRKPVRTWRRIVVIVLLVLLALLTPLSVAGVWVRNQIFDDDTYVATMAPLSQDAAVQQSVANFISAQIFNNVDVQSQVSDALGPRAQALVQPVGNVVRGFISGVVLGAVQSEQFSTAWAALNRAAHHQVVTFLLDRGPATVQGNSLVIDLGDTVRQVQARLVADGFDAAGRIPTERINRQFVIADVSSLIRARDALQKLQGLTTVLPFVTLAVLALAVALSWNRRRFLMIGALVMAGSLAVLAIGLNLARSAYLDQMATRPNLAPGAAAAIFDAVVRFLQNSIRVVFLVAALVALVAFLMGPAGVSVRLRRRASGWIEAARARTGDGTSPAGVWIGAHKTLLRIAVGAIAALLLVFLERPTPAIVLGIAAGLVVVFAGIEIFGQKPRHAPG